MTASSLLFPSLRRNVTLAVTAASLVYAVPIAAASEAQMPVTALITKKSAVTERISVVGTLAAREEVQVHPFVVGKEIRQILVEAGQSVEKGQPLALLDTTEAMMLLDKNAVSLLRAKAAVAVESSKVDVALVNEAEALKKLERSRLLQPKGIIADHVLDEHQNAHARAVAELRLARQSLELATAEEQLIARERQEIELTVERSTLRAPAAGKLLSRSARIGAMTSSSAEPLFLIAGDDDIEFVAQVTETSFVRLREGMRSEIVLPGRDRAVTGIIRLNAAQLDPKTRSGTVRIELAEKEGLIPGVFARGTVNIAERENILVPGSAVESSGGTHSVYVVSDGVVDIRRVRIGSQQSGFVEIVDGVKDGETIALKAGAFLKANERVTPVIAPNALADEPTASLSRQAGAPL
ncbi:efflux RND transporter periplasmic adaptor subunit [Phyllobacterium leguminum]|uniref:RND family efflux transporter MFP subunit n=1 Tax=Phyllobacterium leguminum TaxID=314237 RepID=A0A318SYY5_9HYPH|nr:efflux RND transporter periplasmic adaptor subunit [Phyllobacterium leguminum]PYE86587.1 RND family efflux transporter MFP subunit [Phyllobacterium leguminum]